MVPQNGWFIRENPYEQMDDLGGPPLFLETPTTAHRQAFLDLFVFAGHLQPGHGIARATTFAVAWSSGIHGATLNREIPNNKSQQQMNKNPGCLGYIYIYRDYIYYPIL